MSSNDMIMYKTFYGMHVNDWNINFGTFSNHQTLLVEEYINVGCSTLEYSTATLTHDFIYPHHIKRKYFIEGVISGQITLGASECTSSCTSYTVSLWKIHESGEKNELFTTGNVVVNDTYPWDSEYELGKEIVYAFWIDAWQAVELSEKEKLFLRIEVDCTEGTVLWHSNNATWEDVRIDIPFRL